MIGMTEWSIAVMRAQDAINGLGTAGHGIILASQLGGKTDLHATAELPMIAHVARRLLKLAAELAETPADKRRFEAAVAILEDKTNA